jgi:hypothetical protein
MCGCCLVLTFVLARASATLGLFESFNVLMACAALTPFAYEKSQTQSQSSARRVHSI